MSSLEKQLNQFRERENEILALNSQCKDKIEESLSIKELVSISSKDEQLYPHTTN